VLVRSGSTAIIGHNEDNDVQVGPGAFLQQTTYTSGTLASISAYTYPVGMGFL
jgi:hypothetical protein